jgi:hypothetical protein
MPARREGFTSGEMMLLPWDTRLRQEESEMAEVVYRSEVRIEDRCPVYRSLRAAIAITTELVFEPLP